MKIFNLLPVLFLSLFFLGCSSMSDKVEIKENHFRFENFKREQGNTLEYVHLMCHQKQLIGWQQAKQYVSGEHDMWVRALISKRNVSNSHKEAFVNFKVNLASDKSYMLNRKIEGDTISIWIQEVETGLCVSEIQTADLKPHPIIGNDFLMSEKNKLCRIGSI